jgi:hypothetical protein
MELGGSCVSVWIYTSGVDVYIYIYVYVCVSVCECVCVTQEEFQEMLIHEPKAVVFRNKVRMGHMGHAPFGVYF